MAWVGLGGGCLSEAVTCCSVVKNTHLDGLHNASISHRSKGACMLARPVACLGLLAGSRGRRLWAGVVFGGGYMSE